MNNGALKGWYLQLGGERRGPFPPWQLSRYLLLQRLDRQSLVSRDGESWRPLGELLELQPHYRLAIADLPALERQRLEATEQWVLTHPALFRGGAGGDESATTHLQAVPRKPPNRLLAYSVVGVLLLAVAAIPFLIPAQPPEATAQCDTPPAPGVNWSNCLLSSSYFPDSDLGAALLHNVNLSSSNLARANLMAADLAYANLALSDLSAAQLQEAQLKGANLRNADLRDADLRGADLSYADLSGAQLEGANLTRANLGNAIFEENVHCLPESIGKCIAARSVQ
ncbi:MAG: pentapeptide repeat-containing protein [Gammaproteobacteria bacterium]|nr:pentapeptide repeat-containing protein [Gammaproteobacteria bacterium]